MSSSSSNSNNNAAPAAATSLQLLLREDAALVDYGLTTSTDPDVAFQYAAALLQSGGTGTSSASTTAAAAAALQDVERKLALVESLAVKLSRTSPEAVAGPFLRWHGYNVEEGGETKKDTNNSAAAAAAAAGATTTTLAAVRDRADRLERQSTVLATVATRVESSLQRGVDRLQLATLRLERCLLLSQTLKRLLRLLFEWRKVQTYDLEDVRDLQRAAASIAVLEDLLAQPEWHSAHSLTALSEIPPAARTMARQVRQAAATWWQHSWNSQDGATSLPYLAATLQVYHSLHELPTAVWQAVGDAHDRAAAASVALTTATVNVNDAKTARQQAATEWAAVLTTTTVQVQQLQRVLLIKTDPVTRQQLWHVVAAADTPPGWEDAKTASSKPVSLFALYWHRLCASLGEAWAKAGTSNIDAGLYPAVRGVAKELVARVHEGVVVGNGATLTTSLENSTSTPTGILGGTLSQDFWSAPVNDPMENPQAAPDVWTRGAVTPALSALVGASATTTASITTATTTTTTSPVNWAAIFASSEWEQLQGNAKTQGGLYRLQEAFLQACTQRLCEPLQYLFPEHVTLDEHGVPLSGGALSMLPSKYDIQRFDENIRRELSLADPREGGGDLSLVPMIASCVVDMMIQFGQRAKQALSGAQAQQYIPASGGWTMNESLQHDRKVAVILYTICNHLKNAPDKTFVAPYRPLYLPSHQEAATLCAGALQPAITTLDETVQTHILTKLAQSLNQRMAKLLAKVHLGVYLGERAEDETSATAFCQTQIAPALTAIADGILKRFPPPYATYLASAVASFCIYTFCSNLALLRPLGETARLLITQDLADLEMALEQFMSKTTSSGTSLQQLGKGKPYAELRGVRQMLYWNGLSATNKTPADLARSLLREGWIRHVRPSTVLHFLFSYAPTLLTSPHHTQRVKPETYAQKLVSWDGTSDPDAEETAWMNTLACCDAYQQRQATRGAQTDGDVRIAALLMSLGPELLRRRRS